MTRRTLVELLLKFGDYKVMGYALICCMAGVAIGWIVGASLFVLLTGRISQFHRVLMLAFICSAVGYAGFFWGFIRAFRAKSGRAESP